VVMVSTTACYIACPLNDATFDSLEKAAVVEDDPAFVRFGDFLIVGKMANPFSWRAPEFAIVSGYQPACLCVEYKHLVRWHGFVCQCAHSKGPQLLFTK
jgi:hypothetical protein